MPSQIALLFLCTSDLTPRSLGPIEGSELDVGPDHVLWHGDRSDNGVLYQSFVLIDERRGCTADMPAAGESISFATAVDAEHVYWHSCNKLGAVTTYTDGRPSPALPGFPRATPAARTRRASLTALRWGLLVRVQHAERASIHVKDAVLVLRPSAAVSPAGQ